MNEAVTVIDELTKLFPSLAFEVGHCRDFTISVEILQGFFPALPDSPAVVLRKVFVNPSEIAL